MDYKTSRKLNKNPLIFFLIISKMEKLPDDILNLIWNIYYSENVLPRLGRPFYLKRCNYPANREICSEWYRMDCPPKHAIY